MEKNAAKTYKDPALNKIIQEKAAWNKQVSALINDIIHFKKSMNGWPSKYYKERTRITAPVPVDLSGILGQIAGEFQEIASRGNGILQEQAAFSKSHMKRKTENTLNTLERLRGPVDEKKPAGPTPTPDLTQQLGKGLAAASEFALIKLASDFEDKYFLEARASNPFSRFITRLFNPKWGFGEDARIRRLRMTMLDSCVKSLKALKALHKEIVKSSSNSIVTSHKMMTVVWNYWNIVNRLFGTFKLMKPGPVKETGGPIADPERAKEKAVEEGRDPDTEVDGDDKSQWNPETYDMAQDYARRAEDFKQNATSIKATSPAFYALHSAVESIMAAPKGQKIQQLLHSKIGELYNKALEEVNKELGTNGTSFAQIAVQQQAQGTTKAAQRQLGKLRHQIVPGATSGSRLEVYNMITEIRKNLNIVMDLLEGGFDQAKLSIAINQVNREIAALRTMIRSLYYSEKPEEASSPFF
jgi:hypothetical protein